jgi:putative transferase (TIGR04331 family)
VVVTYPDTTFIEAMVMNSPTIGLWNPDHFEMAADAAPYFDAFVKQGVVYSDPVSAARQLERVYDSAGDWWAAERIQSARRDFIGRFGRSGNWIREWGALLNEWRREPNPGNGT